MGYGKWSVYVFYIVNLMFLLKEVKILFDIWNWVL